MNGLGAWAGSRDEGSREGSYQYNSDLGSGLLTQFGVFYSQVCSHDITISRIPVSLMVMARHWHYPGMKPNGAGRQQAARVGDPKFGKAALSKDTPNQLHPC